jgi:hypothetical protein
MTNEEVPLAGGKLHRVVRVGDTVRRPAGAWTPTVHRLLSHVRERGFLLAPEPLGFDEQGREVLSYVPGDTTGWSMPWPPWVRDESLLDQVGRAAASYHRAVRDFRPAGPVDWFHGTAALAPDEIVCHHDLAPYNAVVDGGQLQAIIDWDLMGPGTVRSELAFIAWQWVPLHDPVVTAMFGWAEPPDRGRRLRILLDAYGLDARAGFVGDVRQRIRLNRDTIIRRAAQGDQAYARLEEEGHVWGMDQALQYLAEVGEQLQSQLG